MNRCLPPKLKQFWKQKAISYSNASEFDQILRLEADVGSVQAVQVRSAYTRVCALELFVSNANYEDIAKAAAETDFKAVLKPGESFVVRINRIKKLR